MANIDELASGGRVTRSLRRRLTSIDSDGCSRADTPTPKLVTISETIDASSAGTPARAAGRRKSINTPVKSLKLGHIQTPVQSDVGSPARRTTRRTSVSATDEEEHTEVAGKMKPGLFTTAVNSPARRSARSRSTSITEEENAAVARVITQTKFETLDENDEDKESNVTSTTKKSPATAKALSELEILESKPQTSPDKYDQNGNTTQRRRSGRSRSIRLNSDVEVINLDDTEMDEMPVKDTHKSAPEISTIELEDSSEEEKDTTKESNKNNTLKQNGDTIVDSTDKTESKNATPKATPLKSKASFGKLTEVVMIEKLNQSVIDKCSNSNKSDLDKSKSVKFDNSSNETDMSKTTYPKTPIFTKSKSFITNDDSKNTEENQSFESSEKSFHSVKSFKDTQHELKSDNNQNTSKKSDSHRETPTNEYENNDEQSIAEKTPLKLKTLKNLQSSTPIVDSTTDMKKQLEVDDDQKLNNISPDKFLRSGKVYGSSPIPIPPKSGSQCPLNTSDSSNNSISKHSESTELQNKSVRKTPAEQTESKSANDNNNSQKTNECTPLSQEDKSVSKTPTKRNESESPSNSKNDRKTNEHITSASPKNTDDLQQKAKPWSEGISIKIAEKNVKIDEISKITSHNALSPQNKNEEITESKVGRKSRSPIRQHASESDQEDDEGGLRSENSLVCGEAEDAGMDYQSGDSMDENERRENEENEIHEEGESLGSEDSEEEDGDDDQEENNSFIATSDDEFLLGYSDDNQHMEDKSKPVYKRIQVASSSDDDIKEDQKSPSKANKSKEKNCDSVDHELALEVSKMIGDVFSDSEFQSLSKSDEPKKMNESMKNDLVLNKTENSTTPNPNNNSKPMKIASDSSSLNQSVLSETAMQLYVSPCSEGTEDEVQLNASRKKILNDFNRSERFNRTMNEVDVEETNEGSEDSPAIQKEVTVLTTTSTAINQKTTAQKTSKSDRKNSLLSQSKEAIYTSSDENEPVSTSILIQKRSVYESSSSEDSDDEDDSYDFEKSKKLSFNKNENSNKRKSLNASKMQPDNSTTKESANKNISEKKGRNSLNISTKKEASLNTSKKNQSQMVMVVSDPDSNTENNKKEEESSARKSLNASKQDKSLNKTASSDNDSEASKVEEANESVVKKSLNISKKDQSIKKLESDMDSDSEDDKIVKELNTSKKDQSLKKIMKSYDSEANKNEKENKMVVKKSINVLKKDESFKKAFDSNKGDDVDEHETTILKKSLDLESNKDSDSEEQGESSVLRKSINTSKKDQSLSKMDASENDSDWELDEEEEEEISVVRKSSSKGSYADTEEKKTSNVRNSLNISKKDQSLMNEAEEKKEEETSVKRKSLNISIKEKSLQKIVETDNGSDSEAEEDEKEQISDKRKSIITLKKDQSLKEMVESDSDSEIEETKSKNLSRKMFNDSTSSAKQIKQSKTKSSNVLGEEDTDSDTEKDNNVTDEMDYDMGKSILKSANKNVSFAEITETRSLKKRTNSLSLSFGPVKQNPTDRIHNSFTIGVSVRRDENSASSTTPDEDLSKNSDKNDNSDDGEEQSDEEALRFSTDEEDQLQKVSQLQKLNEINSDKKQRKSMVLSMSNESVNKKKKQRKASLPYGGDLNPSQSFVENITERKRELQEENEKRKKRLSKSFTDTITTIRQETNTILDNMGNVSKLGKLSTEIINVLPSSTPQAKFSTKGDTSIQRILSRCDEILAVSNTAKQQAKRNNKKVKKSMKNEKVKEDSSKTHTATNEDSQTTTESLLSHSMIKRKEKTKEAVEQALKASAEILLQNRSKNKRKLAIKTDVEEDKHTDKRLPAELLDAIAEENSIESPQPAKRMKKAASSDEFEYEAFKSTAGFVQEVPMTPAAKKKIRKIKLSTGLISEEILTPKKKTQSNGFHESPITPRTGFKVRQILTAGQDVPPELPEMLPKAQRRKRKINEPMLALPKPQWTQSGVFLEETLPFAETVQKVGATEFMVSQLAGGVARTQKMKKMQKIPNATTTVNASALDFKKNSMTHSKIPRESSRAILQRKERVQKHTYF